MKDSMILSKNTRLAFDDNCMNRNICVIGSPGSGKTHSFVKPNILAMAGAGHSMVISDTKGNLSRKYGKYLEAKGYDVKVFDLIDTERSLSYEPFDYIHSERDVLTFASILVKPSHSHEPYWDNMARQYIQALIAYVCLEKHGYPRRFATILDLFSCESYREEYKKESSCKSIIAELMEQAELENPSSFAARAYKFYLKVKGSGVTDSSILSTVSEKLLPYTSSAIQRLFDKNEIDFKAVGDKKTAIFVSVSDNDRSLDTIASLFFSQLLNSLVVHADQDCDDFRLPVPVDFIIDDFGTQTVIPDFDKLIASLRSRNISVSIILQSVSQLRTAYGTAADTIIACCDTQLYFGGSDIKTIEYASKRADVPQYEIMNIPRWKVWVFRRCKEPLLDSCYRLETHPEHSATAEYDKTGLYLSPKRPAELVPVNVLGSMKKMLRYDKLMGASAFEYVAGKAFHHLYGKVSIERSKVLEHTGIISYSFMAKVYGSRVLVMFESRKQLLDEYYFTRFITPLLGHYKYEADHFVLMSFSGFTKEEIEYANERKITLIDRTGLEGNQTAFINPSAFNDIQTVKLYHVKR